MTTFRERIIGLARSLHISREDFTVGPFTDWPGIQKRIEAKFILKTTSDLQPADWPEHFKGKKQIIKSGTFEPYEFLDELIPETEKVWLLLFDTAVKPVAKPWLFQGYVRPVQKVLSQLPKAAFYVIAKKYEWLLYNEKPTEFKALGELPAVAAKPQNNSSAGREKIEIRKASHHDLEHLQQISRKTFWEAFAANNAEENLKRYLDESFTAEKLAAELNNPDSEFYLAEQNGKAIGYLKLNTGPAQTDINDSNALEIERIYVLPEFYGKSGGRLLLEKALAVARQKTVAYVWLGVWEENPRAIRFYQKNGFTAFGKHIFRLGNEDQTDILMKLQLT